MPRISSKRSGDSAPAKSGANQQVRQRPELTFKENRQQGRHGWLRLTPAYSVRLVEQILEEHGEHAEVVLDPFSGTGTTALCAAYRGKTGVATDINPFLVWLAKAKAASYDAAAIVSFKHLAHVAARTAASGTGPVSECPPLSSIDRWWRPGALSFLLRLKAAVDAQAGADLRVAGPGALLSIAFCRTMMKLSNAAFNHQSMSFKDCAATSDPGQGGSAATDETRQFAAQFLSDVEHVGASAADNPSGATEYILADARDGGRSDGAVPDAVGSNAARRRGEDRDSGMLAQWRNRVDLLITSPPYPNRMSYIRELRPYMYWLRFLSTGRQAGELDWDAIGGTWGVATSRLAQWVSSAGPVSSELAAILENIRAAHEDNGKLLANYVHRYFEDLFGHLDAVLCLLRPGASVHYIVGNSIFYGHEVPTERFLAQQMQETGLCDVRIVPLRKRNSKRGLVEFHVSGRRGP